MKSQIFRHNKNSQNNSNNFLKDSLYKIDGNLAKNLPIITSNYETNKTETTTNSASTINNKQRKKFNTPSKTLSLSQQLLPFSNSKSLEPSKSDKENTLSDKSYLIREKEKLKKLVDCYQQLENSNKDFKEITNSTFNNKLYSNELYHTYTKFYRITEKHEQFDVLKLNTWDKDNLSQFYGNPNTIYANLLTYYKLRKEKKKITELENLKRIIDNNDNFVDNLLKNSSNTNNKIIQDYIDKKNLEQGSILHNIITKTQHRFKNDILFGKDKKISLNFGINLDTINALKSEKDIGSTYYTKIIREKDKQEIAKRQELIDLSIKIFNKKQEKEIREKNLGKNFEEINSIIKKYNLEMFKISDAIEAKRELYDKIRGTEIDEKDDNARMIKLDQLSAIQANKSSEEKKLAGIKKELSIVIKKMEKVKTKLNDELLICKNELLFLKIAQITLIKEQRNYYLDLLHKGYDIRNEGLVWIVRRLLEIQTKLEYHHFPKYLYNDQINYIIELANLNLEEAQLKIVLNVLEKKQQKLQTQIHETVMNRILILSNQRHRRQSGVAIETLEKAKKLMNEYKKEKNISNNINEIYKKYESAFKYNTEKQIEDNKEERMLMELKMVLLERGGGNCTEGYDELSKVIEFMNKDQDKKDYFEFILRLKLRMRFLAQKKEMIRKKEMAEFKERMDNDNNRFKSAEVSLKYDLVWGALFGSRI